MSAPTNPLFSRRRFCGLLLTPLAGARADAPPPEPPDPAAVLAAQGTRLLRKGLRFERAADFFVQAAAKDTKNPSYPLALSCALVSRAASLAYTAGLDFTRKESRAKFADTVREWEEMREPLRADDPKGFSDADYDRMRPTLPPVREYHTRDDNQPYRLTREQVQQRLTGLQTKALAAWEKSIALSVTREQKAEAYYVQGWGMRVLSLFLRDSGDEDKPAAVPFAIKAVPKQTDVLAAFDKAIERAPENPLYWQAKGDALLGFGVNEMPDKDDAVNAAYQKALDLRPRNPANLLYLLYNRAAQNASRKPETGWPVALGYLRRASARDRSNAWPLYEEAGILFRSAPYSLTGPSGGPNAPEKLKEERRAAVRNDDARRTGRHAIDRIIDGNRAALYEPPVYADSVPPLLAAAWHYVFPVMINFGSFARVRELARAAAGYAQFMAEYEKQLEEAERAALAVVGMGYKMIGDWPTEDDPTTGKTAVSGLVGVAICSIGYSYAEKVYATLGATEKQTAVQAENAAFKQRVQAYQKAVMESMKRKEAEAD